MNGIIIGEQCPYCTKHRSPLDFIRQPGGVKICTECEQRHLEALQSLQTGQFSGECSECHMQAEELVAQRRCGPLGQMAVHFEGGKYRMMCIPCNKTYVPKRAELYGETEFGKSIGL